MSSPRKHLSWPIAMVAVIALVLGSFGAVGASHAAASLTAKQVKKIAKQVVNKKAKNLSVKFAATAGSAATAGTATSATTAGTAGNAINFGGQPPATYLDRVGYEAISANTPLAAGTSQITNPVAITVPAGVAFVRVDASASFSSGGIYLGLIAQGGPCVAAGDDYSHRQLGDADTRDSVSLTRVYPVTLGMKNYRVCVQTAVATSAGNRAITLQTVATNFDG